MMEWLDRWVARVEKGHVCHVISAGAAIGGIAALASAATSIGMEASGAGKVNAKSVTADPNAVNYGGLSDAQSAASKPLQDAKLGMQNLIASNGNIQDIQKWVDQGHSVQDWLSNHPGNEYIANQYSQAKAAVDSAQGEYNKAPTAVQQMDTAQKQTMQGNVDASNQLAAQGMGEYGGLAQGAGQTAQAAQGREGVQYDPSIQQGYQGLATGQGPMGDSTALWQNAAHGNGPSAAQAQLQAGNDAAMHAQMSMAASARGGSLAASAAQRHAMDNSATLGQQTANQAAMLRAQEMQAAMGGYSQAQQAGLAGMAGAAGQQAQLSAQQRALNDQASMHYSDLQAQQVAAKYGLGAANQTNIQGLQQQSYGNTQGLMGNQMAAGQYATGVSENNANRQAGADARNSATTQSNINMGIGGVSGALTGLSSIAMAPKPKLPATGAA